MTRKEGVYSFTVYCDQAYLEKIKTSAKDSNQKLSAFVLDILDHHFGDTTVSNTVTDTVLTDILARLELIENTVFNKVTDTVINTVADTVTDTVTSEATAPANFPSALLQKVKEVAPLSLSPNQKLRAIQEVKKAA